MCYQKFVTVIVWRQSAPDADRLTNGVAVKSRKVFPNGRLQIFVGDDLGAVKSPVFVLAVQRSVLDGDRASVWHRPPADKYQQIESTGHVRVNLRSQAYMLYRTAVKICALISNTIEDT